MNGAEALIRCLEQEDVRHIFGILGGAIMDVYDVLYDDSSIKHILCRHEQVAAQAAGGYARASGKTGTCMATSGPGATNLTTGITDAFIDSVPVVAITGQVPTTAIGGDSFQEADIVGITMPITKYNYLLEGVDEIPKTVKEAYHIANTGRPGPVLIDFPKDIQRAEMGKFNYPKTISMEGYNPVLKGHPRQIKLAVSALMEAEKPVIVAGGGVIISNASRQLVQFAELLGIPVTTTSMGKGSIAENHPLGLGMLGMHGNKWANLAIQESDCLFAIGTRFSDRITGNVGHFAPNAKIIHADIDPSEIGKNVRVDIPIVGDAKTVLEDLTTIASAAAKKEAERKNKHTAWGKHLEEMKKTFRQDMNKEDIPIKPQRIMKEVQGIIDKNPQKVIITTEVGRNQLWSMHYLNIRYPRHFLTSGGLGCMGAGFPMAIGAKVARPECTLLNMAGDGSFQMTMQDLATCMAYDIPVVNVIMEDSSLGNVRMWQALFYNRRYSQTDLVNNPDFEKIAEAYGAWGKKIEKPGEIKEAIEEAIKSGKPAIVDIIIDRDECVYPMVPPGGMLHKMLDEK
ncbi:MAG: biosynthetic-type acetolactate synthase large subunit [Candidatus Altiarchaeota archaeon]|nr:biosynthetic-type acetolactate synthase large subunit [Candidatus Altiarchaeota archaeon]